MSFDTGSIAFLNSSPPWGFFRFKLHFILSLMKTSYGDLHLIYYFQLPLQRKALSIPLFRTFNEINDLHKATGFHEKTRNPLFHVFNSKVLPDNFTKAMPPYQQAFYQLGLNKEMTGTSFSLQCERMESVNDLLFFVAPGQVITWEVADITDGFLLYFKKDFLNSYIGSIEQTFPFFKITNANYLRLSSEKSKELYEDLAQIRRTFENVSKYQQQQLQFLTLSFLYKCREVFEVLEKQQTPKSRQKELFEHYIQLVNRFFLQYRSIEEYAAILNITPNHLNSVVKTVSGKSPKHFLNERLVSESKNLLHYTSHTISEIAFKLNFSEPTHFIRFFKKETGSTPAEFRLTSH